MHFPVAHQRKPLVEIKNLFDLLGLEDSILTQAQAMIYDSLSERIIAAREAV